MRIKNRGFWLFFALIVLQSIFIWGNSFVPPDDSGAFSGGIMQFFKSFLDPSDRIDPEFFHHIVRKTAHFTEFFLLGALYTGLRAKMTEPFRKAFFLLPPFAGLLTAVLDEFIQAFTGRGSLVTDVVLDFCGVLTGVLLASLYVWRRKQKTIKNTEQ